MSAIQRISALPSQTKKMAASISPTVDGGAIRRLVQENISSRQIWPDLFWLVLAAVAVAQQSWPLLCFSVALSA